MHKGKKAIMTLAAVVLMASQTPSLPSAFAATSTQNPETANIVIRPMWVDAEEVTPQVSYNGQELKVSLTVFAKSKTTTSSGNLYLQEYRGGMWKTVRTQSIRKTGNFNSSFTCTGKAGTTYRAKVVVTVGTECISSVSESITI